MINEQQARQLAQGWVAAWNRHDLNGIMNHYADNVEFWSPTVISRQGIPSGKIQGKAKLREHFAKGLELFGNNIRFDLLQVLVGVDGMTVYYRRENDAEVADVVVLDENNKAVHVRAFYSHRVGE